MEINVIKKKTEAIEDAEIVATEKTKLDEKQIFNLKSQVLIFCAVLFVILILIFGFFWFYEKKLSEEISELEIKLESLLPIVSVETMEARLNEFEVFLQRENTNLFNKEIENLENIFNQKIKSVSDLIDNSGISTS